jgi:hypothetical protein
MSLTSTCSATFKVVKQDKEIKLSEKTGHFLLDHTIFIKIQLIPGKQPNSFIGFHFFPYFYFHLVSPSPF